MYKNFISAAVTGCLAVLLFLAGNAVVSFPAFAEDGRMAPEFMNAKREFLQLRPESSKEFSRRYVLNERGVAERVHISYRNGERGLLVYRPDATRQSFQVWFANKKIKRSEVYDSTGGIVVSGVFYRTDGSLIWQVRLSSDGEEVTRDSFYKDGKVFLQSRLNLKNGKGTSTFFHHNARGWIQFDTDNSQWGFSAVRIWDLQGRLRGEGVVGTPEVGNEQRLFLHRFDEKGQRQFTQHYMRDRLNANLMTNGLPDKKLELSVVTFIEYDQEGRNPKRTVEVNPPGKLGPHSIFRVIQLNEDGSYQWRFVRYNRSVYLIQDYRADNSLVSYRYLWDDSVKEQILDEHFQKPVDDLEKVFEVWKIHESVQ